MYQAGKATRSLAQKAYRQLKEDILTAKLRPGEMILGTKLAQKYRMSRTPVHEALKLLCTEGLVAVIPRVGYVVTELTVADVQEVFQLRLAAETLAAELAVDHVSASDIEAFERLQRSIQTRGRSLAKDPAAHRRFAIDANTEFHLTVARLSGNRRLVELIASLLDESRRTLLLDPMVTGYVNLPTNDHSEVVEALARRDRKGAREAMARHMREGQRRIVEMLLGEGTGGSAATVLAAGTPKRSKRRAPSSG